MRTSRLFIALGLTLGLAGSLGSAAFAAGSRVGLLPWAELDLIPAAPESPALGPDLLAAGPDGQLALWNPAEALVHVYDSVDAALAGDTGSAFALAAADDLAWTGSGIIVLDGRRISLFSASGQLLSERALPELVPTGARLQVDGDQVYGADVFGNRHPAAQLVKGALVAPSSQKLLAPADPVRWDAASQTMRAGGQELALKDAIKAGGRVIRGGGQRWLVVDAVVGDAPLRIQRQVLSLDSGARATIPVEGRLYAPTLDVAVDGRGALIWMAPQRDGLRVGEVLP